MTNNALRVRMGGYFGFQRPDGTYFCGYGYGDKPIFSDRSVQLYSDKGQDLTEIVRQNPCLLDCKICFFDLAAIGEPKGLTVKADI